MKLSLNAFLQLPQIWRPYFLLSKSSQVHFKYMVQSLSIRLSLLLLSLLSQVSVLAQMDCNLLSSIATCEKCQFVILERNSDLHIHFGNEYLTDRFTPTIEQVNEAEKMLGEQIHILFQSDVRLKYVDRIPNYPKEFRKWNRQYFGYINSHGEKLVVIHLLNFTNKRKARSNFPSWNKEFIVGFGEFYEKNVRLYQYNLVQRIISLP